MIDVLTNIAVALLVLGVIIVIHEAGHFFVAKLFRIRVETFSVGFGPRLFGIEYGDTDYRLSAFPLGGYVKMSGENPGDEVTGDPREFMSKPKWQRFLVAAAGPAMNGVLAVGLLAGMYMYGVEERRPPTDMTIGNVVEGSPAQAAGILVGDVIVEFDGETDVNWGEIELEVILGPDIPIAMVLDRDGQRIEATVTPDRFGPREIGFAGFEPEAVGTEVIGYSMDDSPAEQAGLLVGDQIVGIGDVDLQGASTLGVIEALQAAENDVVSVTVLRNGETLALDAQPMVNEEGNRILGIQIDAPLVYVQLGAVQAVWASIRWNTANAALIFDILGRLIRGEASPRAMDGPIGIIRETGRRYQQGYQELLLLVVIISLNLGVINLLPIPILDGGVMLMLVIEGVMRQDLSLAMKERIAQLSFVFLLTVMGYVLYIDFLNLQIGQ
jgi:regulator of sigma E protease